MGDDEDVSRRLGDYATGTAAVLLVLVGMRSGLLDALDGRSLSADELAARCGAAPASVREWLAGMTAAGFADQLEGRYRLRGSTLRHPAIRSYLEVVAGQLSLVDAASQAVRSGGGLGADVLAEAYQPAMWAMNERRVEADLVQHWLAADGVRTELVAGGSVHELGCGGGHVLTVLARTFPGAWVVGHDSDPAAVARARRACADLPNVAVTDAQPGARSADVVLAVDTLHHLPDPAAALAGWARALRPGGYVVVVEPDIDDDTPPDVRLAAATAALLYCLPDAQAAGGPGLGAAVPHRLVRGWMADARLAIVGDIVSPTGFRAVTGQAPRATG